MQNHKSSVTANLIREYILALFLGVKSPLLERSFDRLNNYRL